jgi:hypothetical protein
MSSIVEGCRHRKGRYKCIFIMDIRALPCTSMASMLWWSIRSSWCQAKMYVVICIRHDSVGVFCVGCFAEDGV